MEPRPRSASDPDGDYRGGGSDQDLPRLSEERGPAGGPARALSSRIQGSQGRRPRQLLDRAGRDGRLPRAERGGQDDDAQDALGPDRSDGRPGARPGLRPRAAGRRLPTPVRAGYGAEEPALVGPPRRRQLPAPPRDLFHPPGRVPAHPGRADRAARRRGADPAGGPRALARRADEDGADRRAVAPAPTSPARRADDRPGRRGAGGDPEVPARLPRPTRGDDAPDQPLHARRRGALLARAG